jgi:hypothetical protein
MESNVKILFGKYVEMFANGILAIMICVILSLPVSSTAAGIDPASQTVLKHRIAVIALSELSKEKERYSILFKSDDSIHYMAEEGTLMEAGDQASIVDLIKGELSKSEFLRVVELPKTLAKKDIETNSGDQPGLIALLSFGVSKQERKLFTRLLEVSSGQTVFSVETAGADFRTASRECAASLDNWLLKQAWRCRVIGVRGHEMVINRGRLDGIREGTTLVGYSFKGQSGISREPEEESILKYGTRCGTYTVVEARNNFARVKAVESGRILGKGDILEMPEVVMPERDIKSRGSRIWDKIYE